MFGRSLYIIPIVPPRIRFTGLRAFGGTQISTDALSCHIEEIDNHLCPTSDTVYIQLDGS